MRAGTVPVVPEPAQGEPPFNGHLTLARAKGRLGAAAQAELAGIPFEAAFPVQHVDLVASEALTERARLLHARPSPARIGLSSAIGSTALPRE